MQQQACATPQPVDDAARYLLGLYPDRTTRARNHVWHGKTIHPLALAISTSMPLPAALLVALLFTAAGFGLGAFIFYVLRRLFGDLKAS